MKYLNELLEYDKKNNVKHNVPIEQAIKKHKRIHDRAQKGIYKYKPEIVESVINFVEHEFYKTTGELELIKLQPAQKWWLELWFGYYTKNDDILINETFLNIIRGAGKSTLMAAIEMYWMLYGGNYGGESLVIAYDNAQADHVFSQVRNQITTGNGLLSQLGEQGILKTTKSGIVFTPNKNQFKKQTNDVHRAQGGNTSLNIFDEIHVYKDDVVSTVNKGSRQKQSSWRSIYITSGGIVRGYLYDNMIKRFTSEEEFESDRSIGLIYRLDDPSEVKQEANWTKAGPMIVGGLPKLASVREEYQLAKGDPSKQIQFLAYNMGVAVQDKTKYLLDSETSMTEYDFDDVWSGADVIVGIDLSLVGDLTAVTFMTEKDGVTYVHVEGVGARNTLKQLPQSMAKQLEVMPDLTISDNAFIHAEDVLEIIKKFVDRTNCALTFIGYDPARYELLQELIDDYFFDVDEERQVKVRQGFALSDYIKLMKFKLSDGTLIHNSPLLQWSMRNFAVKIGTSGDVMATKLNDDEKIDPVVATIIALKTAVVKGL